MKEKMIEQRRVMIVACHLDRKFPGTACPWGKLEVSMYCRNCAWVEIRKYQSPGRKKVLASHREIQPDDLPRLRREYGHGDDVLLTVREEGVDGLH